MDSNLLDGLSDPDRDLVLSRMSRRTYSVGEMLILDGDVGDSMHIIEQGKVAVRKSTVRGEVVTLTILGPGASFGEQALLSTGARRTAHIVALEPVVTRVMYRSDFEALRRRHRPSNDSWWTRSRNRCAVCPVRSSTPCTSTPISGW